MKLCPQKRIRLLSGLSVCLVAFLVAPLLLVGTSCRASEESTSSFFLMDTQITVTLYTDRSTAEPIFLQCRSLLSGLDALWAKETAGSDIDRLNRSDTGIDDADARTVELIRKALQVAADTGGAFDPTVAPLTDLWRAAGEANRLPTDAEMQKSLGKVSYRKLSVDGQSIRKGLSTLTVDLGGIGKGAAISLLRDYLQTTGVSGGLISFGSNVAVFGKKPDGTPFRIALRDPGREDGIAGTLLLSSDTVLSVSGDYERYVTIDGTRYHYLYDPSTGYPAENGLCSVAVLTADGALADALSTALFVMGEEKALKYYTAHTGEPFEAIFLRHDGTVRVTKGLEGGSQWTEAGR